MEINNSTVQTSYQGKDPTADSLDGKASASSSTDGRGGLWNRLQNGAALAAASTLANSALVTPLQNATATFRNNPQILQVAIETCKRPYAELPAMATAQAARNLASLGLYPLLKTEATAVFQDPAQASLAAGALSGALAGTLKTPMKYFKVSLPHDDKTLFEFRRQLPPGNTIRSYFKGATTNAMQEGIGLGSYFYTAERLRAQMKDCEHDTAASRFSKDALAGGIAGIVGMLVQAPLQMVSDLRQQAASNRSNLKAASEILAKEGGKGFFKGIGGKLAPAFVAGAALKVLAERLTN